jgi:hypothetical protein
VAQKLVDALSGLDREGVLADLLADIRGQQRLQRPERQRERAGAAAAVGEQQPAVQRRQGAPPARQGRVAR